MKKLLSILLLLSLQSNSQTICSKLDCMAGVSTRYPTKRLFYNISAVYRNKKLIVSYSGTDLDSRPFNEVQEFTSMYDNRGRRIDASRIRIICVSSVTSKGLVQFCTKVK